MSAHGAFVAALIVLTAFHVGNAEGQESDKLLPATRGYLLVPVRGCGIDAIELPTLKKTVVRPAAPQNAEDWPTLHLVSGPDAEGRIAYIEDHGSTRKEADKRHILKAIMVDGTQDTKLFSRPGDALWSTSASGKGEMGGSLALSPVGGRVAFHTDLAPIQMPGSYTYFGPIEIWTIDRRESIKLDLKMRARTRRPKSRR